MKKKKLFLFICIPIGILLIVAVLFLNSEFLQKKRFAKLGAKFTRSRQESWKDNTDLVFPRKVLDKYKKTEDYIESIDYFFNYRERVNLQCEIRNCEVTNIQKCDIDELDSWFDNWYDWFEDCEVKEIYQVSATMKVRYRCDYGDEDISYIEPYIDEEPYCYNGYWSEWREETHEYVMYRIGLEWCVLSNDNEEDGSS